MAPSTHDDETPVFVISVAAELAGMHAQTLRQYDRLGLVTPSRTRGGGRRYSQRDVALLREVQRLSQDEGVSLAGIQQILELTERVSKLEQQLEEALAVAERARAQAKAATERGRSRVFAAGRHGIETLRHGQRPSRPVSDSRAIVLWRPPTG